MRKNKQAKPNQTTGEKSKKSAKGKVNYSSPMSNTAWTNLNSKRHILKLHDICGEDGCKCKKRICLLLNNLKWKEQELKRQ